MTGARPPQPFRVVFFDCDSTLSAVEGIDELARAAGMAQRIEELTRKAMDGEVSLESVYGLRLELVKPGRRAVEDLGRLYVERMVSGAKDVVAALARHGKEIHVVSGGVLPALLPLACELGIPPERVHAVDLRFTDEGEYAGFDSGSPLWRTGGKAEACRRVLVRTGGPSAIVGDGKTDLEARPPCDVMVGFGGVAERAIVREQADAWVAGPSLLPVLDHLLTAAESSPQDAADEPPRGVSE